MDIIDIKTSIIVRKLSPGSPATKAPGVPEPFEISTVSINLRSKLKSFEHYSFERNQKRFFHPTIEVRNEGLEIVLIKLPTKGYKAFCEDCSQYATVNKLDEVSDYQRKNKIGIDAATVVLISLIVCGVILITTPQEADISLENDVNR